MPHSVFHDQLLLRTLRWNEIENMYLLRTAPRRDLQINGLLDLDSMDFTTFYRSFRFQKGDLEDLMENLADSRRAYPNRLCELELFFRRHSSVISSVVSKVLAHIDYYFAHLLADLTVHKWLNLQSLEMFSQETALYRNLETVTQGRTYVIYGDPTYPLRPLLYKPFGGASLRPHEVNFNKRMSSVRQPVEWGFGRVVADFAFVDFYKGQKMTRQRTQPDSDRAMRVSLIQASKGAQRAAVDVQMLVGHCDGRISSPPLYADALSGNQHTRRRRRRQRAVISRTRINGFLIFLLYLLHTGWE
ncbi:hypothetical protein HPB51_022373 [Rhipicephalus microplus]|uniref:DDE Tnp4 domain-containing protein n=1 Tax=Rhipicephalus microplus TaxID=6941 RepID=A0A9J6DQQ7_RHIMP|nr:hypothetical protein HPB51_022373 [Rhipicephalus microplus]